MIYGGRHLLRENLADTGPPPCKTPITLRAYYVTLVENRPTLSAEYPSLPSARQHPSHCDCLEVKREYYQNCSVLGCARQCSQSAAYSCEQFILVQQIGFVTLGPLRHA